jgi:ribonucleoside-diphosphate reductase alpha chain
MSNNFNWINEDSELFLKRGYLMEGVTPKERIRQIADTAEKRLGIKGYSDKFYDYMGRGWYSLSSPVWSNFGLDRGLPISCFGTYMGDSIKSILQGVGEVGVMSQLGGGTSGYFGHIRGRGSAITNNGKSNGSFPFAKMFDTTIDVISQGTTRKGQFAGYIDLDHPDAEEWLGIQLEGNPIQLMYYAICVSNEWLDEMRNGEKGKEKQPKRELWAKVIQCRNEIGVPYILFKDNANNNTVDVYKDKGMKIHASNLCSEIMLPSSEEESFVCCLSSMNLLYYDDWKDTDAVEVLTMFLDTVMSEFIDKTENIEFMERANLFARRHRALGLGVLGWHSYLQSNMIPFDSMDAMMKNAQIFKNIKEQAYKASEKLADMFGEPEILKGYGRRNTTLLAIAPTKSSSFILGQVSPSIEPIKSNYYVKDLAKIKTTYRNPYLIELLKEKGENTPAVWDTILAFDGSVQHLDFLSDLEKDVFKTFSEISQLTVIQQAAQRQQFIDQGQSLNLMIHPRTRTQDINSLYMAAADLGVKSLYYQLSVNAAQEFNRDLTTCSNCEG